MINAISFKGNEQPNRIERRIKPTLPLKIFCFQPLAQTSPSYNNIVMFTNAKKSHGIIMFIKKIINGFKK